MQRGAFDAEMWVVTLRDGVNHRGDNTTSICEGYHAAVKGPLRGTSGESLRLDRLIHHLLTFVAATYVDKDIRRCTNLGMPHHG
jgi:hypothetical protein